MSPLVLFELASEVLAPLLTARPALADALSRSAATHLAADLQLRHPADAAPAALSMPAQIAARIRLLFGL